MWLPTFNSPGLAMARSFGDFCLKNYGIISIPDVSYHRITEKDEFVVLATDGVSTDLHKHLDCRIFVELDIVKSYEVFLLYCCLGFFADCRYGMYFRMMKLLASSAKPLHRSQQPGFLLNRLRGHGGLGTPHQRPMTVLLSVCS